MSAIDRWEDDLEREHPIAYVALCSALVLLVAFAVLALLYVLVPEVPAT